MVKVAEAGHCQLERAEADVVQGFVVQHKALIRVLHQLVHRQGGVVGLHHCVRHLGRGDDRECHHHAVWVLLQLEVRPAHMNEHDSWLKAPFGCPEGKDKLSPLLSC